MSTEERASEQWKKRNEFFVEERASERCARHEECSFKLLLVENLLYFSLVVCRFI
jgi:hypothetical protein